MDRQLDGSMTSYDGRHFQIDNASVAPQPIQRPRPPITIAAHGSSTVKIAAQHADVRNTAGLYWKLDRERATDAHALRVIRELAQRLDEEAMKCGRDPATIGRSILVGGEWPVATAAPRASVGAFGEFVGCYLELGFTEFICPESTADQYAVMEADASEVLPVLRAE